MGTFASDTVYSAARGRIPYVTKAVDRAISRRWNELRAVVSVELRRVPGTLSHLDRLDNARATHRSYLLACIALRLRWDVIRRHHLDWPLTSPSEAHANISAAAARSAAQRKARHGYRPRPAHR